MNPSGRLAPPSHTTRGTRHGSAPSQDTTASGIADSTISNGGESLVLSQFPTPPVSIPSTPIHTDFGTSIASGSPIRTTPAVPLRVVRRKPLPVPGPLQKAQSKQASTSTTPISPAQSSSSQRNPISPYDWHDGASSIGMDATEDKLLSTSFITNLLQESANKRGRRLSNGSSAISGFSEMTYPPLASTVANMNLPSSSRPGPSRPQGSRPPPSSFMPIPESPDPLMMSGDGDSETLYSQRDQHTVIRAEVSPQPVGMAQAVLRNISPAPGNPLHHISSSEPLVPPNFPIPRNRKVPSSNFQSRESVHSTKSAVSSFISRISGHPSVQRVIGWRRAKPLPPVPLIPHIPITAEVQHRREDETKPLPDLVHRADALHGLLEKGYHPHHSLRSYYAANKEHSQFDDDTILHAATTGTFQSGLESRSTPQPSFTLSRNRETPVARNPSPNKRRKWVLIAVSVAVIVVIAVVVGVVVGRKRGQPTCAGNLAGAACNLNAACTCTTQDSSCNALAQNIVDLVPSLNTNFALNLSANQVYNKIWLVQGSTPDSCKQQAILVDVGPDLNADAQPKVTQWAQSALLWAVVLSQDLTGVAKLQTFVQKAPWASFSPSGDASKFTTTALGYTFNFATQTITPAAASFTGVGQPNADQLSRVNTNAKAALDRMYSFAQAGSTLRQNALQLYWTNVLKQNSKDLRTFVSAITVSPVLLPFDATSDPVSKLLNSTSDSFPPPLSCYPGLTASQLDQITKIESGVFNLPTPPSVTQFDSGCFPDRPIYGVLDVLRLRLPSPDPRAGVPRQAAVLKAVTSPRVLLRKGATLSPLPGPTNVTNITSTLSDPRDYGTLGLASHVILDYLSSIPSVDLAQALVQYILSSTTAQIPPPDNSSILFTSFSQVPALEVAVFGSVLPSDIDHARSAFTTSSGSLFFGTDKGTALRNWVLTVCNSATAWTETLFSPKIVRDSSFLEPVFNATWTAAAAAIRGNVQNVGLFNVTHSFDINGRFSVY